MGVVRGGPRAARLGGPSPRHGGELRTAGPSGCWSVGVGCFDWGDGNAVVWWQLMPRSFIGDFSYEQKR